MHNRREFLQQSFKAAAAFSLLPWPVQVWAADREDYKITILHTNDVHSHLEPFPLDHPIYPGQGGVAYRAAIIEEIRRNNKHVLLLDAGDIFQGTPYFNLYKGEPEIKAMSKMKYDACTMGNHDFDAGVEGFAAQLIHADFPVLTANYDFSQTALADKTQPYQIYKKGKIKVGVFGIGIRLKGLVPDHAFGKTVYLEPVRIANQVANHLRKKEGCHLIICLSHLGYSYNSRSISDIILAKETENIDLIIGGHTHTFLDEPTRMMNKAGKPVAINQVGFAGVRLGRINYDFSIKKDSKISSAHTVVLHKQTIG